MDQEALVYVDLNSEAHLVGRLWSRSSRNRESATFEYDAGWVQHPARFSLEPALKLGPGPFHAVADLPMLGAIGDSAPDRWGRTRGWSAGVLNEKAVHSEHFRRWIICCLSMMRYDKGRCA